MARDEGPQACSSVANNWRDLDYLIVDMPPGTGDIQLTLAQQVPVTGVVIVTTPQDIALMDAKKGLKMFEKVGVPILGIVENMAVHVCSNCGHAEHIFGSEGGQKMATEYGVDFLGSLRLIFAFESRPTQRPTVIARHSPVAKSKGDSPRSLANAERQRTCRCSAYDQGEHYLLRRDWLTACANPPQRAVCGSTVWRQPVMIAERLLRWLAQGLALLALLRSTVLAPARGGGLFLARQLRLARAQPRPRFFACARRRAYRRGDAQSLAWLRSCVRMRRARTHWRASIASPRRFARVSAANFRLVSKRAHGWRNGSVYASTAASHEQCGEWRSALICSDHSRSTPQRIFCAAALRLHGHLVEREWRRWALRLLESHASHLGLQRYRDARDRQQSAPPGKAILR